MIAKYHWLAALLLAISLHGVAFLSFAHHEHNQFAKEIGEKGIEVDLGMLGDLGVATAATEVEVAEADPELIEDEPETDSAEDPEEVMEPNPIATPNQPEQRPVIDKQVVKVKKLVNKQKPKKITKQNKKEPIKNNKTTQQAEAKPPQPPSKNKAKTSNVEARKISTGSKNTLSTGGNKGKDQSYIALVSSKLARYKRYPNSERKQNHEGTVLLFFTIRRDGKVIDSSISESSGYKKLDRAVIRMLKKAAPFPPFPSEMDKQLLSIRIPIEFKLNDKR
jgi:protein TonB